MKHRWFHSLTFRITSLNMIGFLVTCLAFFTFLDRYQHRTLLARIDKDLEDQVLMVTSHLDAVSGEDDAIDLEVELGRMSRARGIALGFFRLLDADGSELVTSDLSFWPGVGSHRVPLERLHEAPLVWETAPLKAEPCRVIYYRFPDGRLLQIGHDLAGLRTMLGQTRGIIGSGMVLVVLVAGLFSWLVIYRGLGGIRQVSETAALIREQGQMAHRVPTETGSDETDRLAHTFNRLLDHLQTLMANLRYVMDNIAHDIKTPVTRMRGLAEAELRKPDAKDPDLSGRVVEECDMILNLVNTLLQITAAESGLYQFQIEDIDLAELVREGCELFEPVLEDGELTLDLDVPDQLTAHTDGRVLQRVVANLVDNAIKYNNAGGKVTVRLGVEGAWGVLRVSDTGIGLSSEDQRLIFDRFYRSDRSRTRPGNGLGLSFCKAAMEALGGEIGCSGATGEGATFTVRVPLSA